MKNENVAGAISAVLVLLFVYTASSKFLGLQEFKGNMLIQPFPHWFARILVWVIPLSELFVSVCLAYRPARRAGLLASLVLMLLFTIYIAAILLHLFPKTPCSCGGVLKQLGWRMHFWFNTGLLLLISLGLRFSGKQTIHSPINPYV